MRMEFGACWFRITIELFWAGPETVWRRYRVSLRDAAMRRKLFHKVRKRLKAGIQARD